MTILDVSDYIYRIMVIILLLAIVWCFLRNNTQMEQRTVVSKKSQAQHQLILRKIDHLQAEVGELKGRSKPTEEED